LRYAPADFVFATTMYIFDKKVAIISSRQENFAITIESDEFTKMQTNLLEILWSASLPGLAVHISHNDSMPSY
jgi:HTH-type transcriptional regulator, sugar sensing transcriptional regulator